MAKINLVNAVIGVAVGGVDSFLEDQDAANARVEEAKKWAFWFRAGATVLGYAGQLMGWMPSYAAPLAQSSVPLLTKSVYKMVKTGTATSAHVVSRPRAVVARMASVSQTTRPEFEGQRSY